MWSLLLIFFTNLNINLGCYRKIMASIEGLIKEVSSEATTRFTADTEDVFAQLKKQFVESFAANLDSKLKTLISYDAHGWDVPKLIPLEDIITVINKYGNNYTRNDTPSQKIRWIGYFRKKYHLIRPVKMVIVYVSGNSDSSITSIAVWSLNGMVAVVGTDNNDMSSFTTGYDMPNFVFDLIDSFVVATVPNGEWDKSNSRAHRAGIHRTYGDAHKSIYFVANYYHNHEQYGIDKREIEKINKFITSFQTMNLVTPFNARGRALEDENKKLREERDHAIAMKVAAEEECEEMETEMNEFENWRDQISVTEELEKELEIKREKIKQLLASLKSRERDLDAREKKLTEREADLLTSGVDIDELLK